MGVDEPSPVVRVLGSVSLVVGGRPLPLGGPVPRRLLAVLLVNRGAVVSVDRLVEALWVEDPPETAVTSLRSHVSRLRGVLPPSVRLETAPPGYRLQVEAGAVDADWFEAALGEALGNLDAAPNVALSRLDEALGVWGGDAFAEFAGEWWAQGEAARLEERRLHAREVRAETLLALGRNEAAVTEARSLTIEHPERERGWASLVKGLYVSNRQRDALRCAQEYRSHLRDNWGLNPSAAFEALEREVATDVPQFVRREEIDRGRSASSGEVRLPDQLTSFHGRSSEGEAVTALLGTERLVSLLGAGGMGKTRLALHAAALAAPAFPDGVWFCPLAELEDAGGDGVAYAAADAIGIRPEEGATMADTLANWIGERRALLVLDNCEHVRDDAAALAKLLLGKCPRLTALTTSREPLHLPGETRSFVGPLDAPAARALFLDRLHAFDPAAGMGLAEDEVAELCERLGNMPLAIELAAARCRATSPGELTARLEQRPELLADRSRPPAQQTLTSVLDWSVGQLSPLARDVFARLSVFHGGCTLELAEQVVSGGDVDTGDVLDAFGSLVDAGLVNVDRTEPRVRYLQLEPIRQHGSRLLTPDERAELAHRHGVAFAEFATAVGRGLEGPDFGSWAEAADRELANLRAAHQWAVRDGQAEVAVDIVAGLREYLAQRVMTEICDWNDATVAMTKGQGGELEATALGAAAVGWFHQRRYREVIDAFEWIRGTSFAGPDLLAQVAGPAGWSSMNLHNYTDAEAFWTSGLAANPSPWNECFLRSSLSVQHRTHRALVVQVIERVGSPTLTAWYHIWGARISGPPERLAETEALLAEVVDETSRIGAIHPLGVALYCLGFVQAQLPDRSTKDVLALFDRAIALWSRLRMPVQLLAALEAAALALALRGAPGPAHTVIADIDTRGGTVFHGYRKLAEEALAAIPPTEVRAWQQRAAAFTTIDDLAEFARTTIKNLVT